MNRRSILGLIGAAPFAGDAAAKGLASTLSGAVPPSHPYPESVGAAGMNAAQQIGAAPRMERSAAMRMIFGDKSVLDEIRAELFAENRGVAQIDSDIWNMKSWSDMAKITFQRQRNVERALAEIQSERWDRPNRYVRAIEDRLQKLMWGK